MASLTKKTAAKRSQRQRRAGRQRKRRQARRSTLSYTELFAGFGEPGQPAPNPVPATTKSS